MPVENSNYFKYAREQVLLAPACRKLQMEVVSASADSLIMRMPVQGNTQMIGFLHGGATAALCETIGSMMANIDAKPGYFAVGTELSISHYRPALKGYVVGSVTRNHLGRKTAAYSVKVTREGDGKTVSMGYHTCMFIPDPRNDKPSHKF